jgi:phosphatidylserine/phosphatidylglycerophosphate/cardiolipin synthase-like enzyme
LKSGAVFVGGLFKNIASSSLFCYSFVQPGKSPAGIQSFLIHAEKNAMRVDRSAQMKFYVLMCLAMLSAACAKVTPVNVCFSPGGDCISSVTAEIENAKTEIQIQAYSLSSKPIADAVVMAKRTGVNVEILLDKSSAVAQNNAVYFASLKGIPTYLDAQHAVADNNVIIIDKSTVITGSFNFSKEADARNAENLLIIKSDRLAGIYFDNWELHKSHAEKFKAPEQPQAQQKPKSDKKKAGKKKKNSPGAS